MTYPVGAPFRRLRSPILLSMAFIYMYEEDECVSVQMIQKPQNFCSGYEFTKYKYLFVWW